MLFRHTFLVTLSSVAVSLQKGRSRVNKCIKCEQFDVTLSRQANASACIANSAKKIWQLRNLEKAQQEAKCHDYRKRLRV